METPGTASKAGLIVHCVSTPISIGDSDFEESPTNRTRLVADLGGSMVGADDTLGSMNVDVRRSDVSCRARMKSVPGSK